MHKLSTPPFPLPPPTCLRFFVDFYLNTVFWRATALLVNLLNGPGGTWAQGNFDVVIENDDLDRAVSELSDRLRDWFPKIRADIGGGGHVGGDEKR